MPQAWRRCAPRSDRRAPLTRSSRSTHDRRSGSRPPTTHSVLRMAGRRAGTRPMPERLSSSTIKRRRPVSAAGSPSSMPRSRVERRRRQHPAAARQRAQRALPGHVRWRRPDLGRVQRSVRRNQRQRNHRRSRRRLFHAWRRAHGRRRAVQEVPPGQRHVEQQRGRAQFAVAARVFPGRADPQSGARDRSRALGRFNRHDVAEPVARLHGGALAARAPTTLPACARSIRPDRRRALPGAPSNLSASSTGTSATLTLVRAVERRQRHHLRHRSGFRSWSLEPGQPRDQQHGDRRLLHRRAAGSLLHPCPCAKRDRDRPGVERGPAVGRVCHALGADRIGVHESERRRDVHLDGARDRPCADRLSTGRRECARAREPPGDQSRTRDVADRAPDRRAPTTCVSNRAAPAA